MRYEFDVSAVSVTFKTFPKGDYEFTIGEVKSFKKTSQEGEETYGIRFPMKCVAVVEEGDSAMVGERANYDAYLHGEPNPFAVAFVMAVLGFPITEDGERAFKEKYEGEDWGYDADNGTVGDMWSKATGGRLIAHSSPRMYEGTLRNNFESFRSVSS